MAQDETRGFAAGRVASEDVVLIIGVDADGTLRPCMAVRGRMDATYAAVQPDWLTRPGGLLALVAEAQARAGELLQPPGAVAALSATGL